jgi:hypothetical protein
VLVAGDIEIHFEPEHGDLSLTCGDAVFDRIRRAICSEFEIESAVGHPAERIRHIEIMLSPAQNTVQAGWQLAIKSGCLVAAVVILAVLGIGAITIVKWLLAVLG